MPLTRLSLNPVSVPEVDVLLEAPVAELFPQSLLIKKLGHYCMICRKAGVPPGPLFKKNKIKINSRHKSDSGFPVGDVHDDTDPRASRGRLSFSQR